MKILRLTIEQKHLSNAEVELDVVVEVEKREASLEIRGSLAGPRCPNVESIQLAYPLRPIRRQDQGDNVLLGHIVIPEPNCWTPEMPYVYEGAVELWQEGKCVDRKPIRTAFKTS